MFVIAFGILFITFLAVKEDKPSNDTGIVLGPAFGILIIVTGLSRFLSHWLSYRNTLYGYSNKRIMIRTGILAPNFKVIDHDKIIELEVTVGWIESLCHVGTIQFFSGRTEKNNNNVVKIFDEWEAIPNCYDVFKTLKQTIVDVKTDYTYPNALRPDTNPSYNTRYDRN